MDKTKFVPGTATLCYLIDKERNQILLGRKKYGGAKGKLNGFGGKVEYSDKSMVDAVTREFDEETSIRIMNPILTSIIHINNFNSSTQKEENMKIYTYIATEWSGVAKESEEMTVSWIHLDSVPYKDMWENDKLWFNTIISGKKTTIELSHIDGTLKSLAITFLDDLNGDNKK